MSCGPAPTTPHALPRDLTIQAVELFGRDVVVEWCEELLSGRATDHDENRPDIGWLGGTEGWASGWSRTWGARGLLHIGPPNHPAIVWAALEDEFWRVREMSLKVIRRHGLHGPHAFLERLVADPVERVRIQAWMALGLPVPHEQQV
jgi:hypothetical protein